MHDERLNSAQTLIQNIFNLWISIFCTNCFSRAVTMETLWLGTKANLAHYEFFYDL